MVAPKSDCCTRKLHLHKIKCWWLLYLSKGENELIYIQYFFDAQNSGFLIYAQNALRGGVGGEIFTIVMAAENTVHISFKLTHGTTCYLHTNIPIDDYHSHMSIL